MEPYMVYLVWGIFIAAVAGGILLAKHLTGRKLESFNKVMLTIQMAAQKGDLDQVKQALATGADINGKDKTDFTALHAAAHHGHRPVAEYLISKGADVNVKGNMGWTALHSAAAVGHRDVVELLLQKGADINAIDVNQETPLHLVTDNEDIKDKRLVEILVLRGADVNAKNKWGRTPLKSAMRKGNLEIAGVIRKAGGRE